MAVLSVNGGAERLVLDIIEDMNESKACCFCPDCPPLLPPALFAVLAFAVTSL